MSMQVQRAEEGVLSWIDRDITKPLADFQDPNQEWRRLVSEFYGTFLLVLVAAGGGLSGSAAAQGALYTEAQKPEQT